MEEKSFQIIPAIDIYDNKVVRLYKGIYENIKIYYENPLDVFLYFQDIGIKRVHIVDLNAARNGDISINQKSILNLIRYKNSCILEIGGGIRTREIIQYYIDIGIDFLILGTIAVKNPVFVENMLEQFSKEKFIIGVDAINNEVKISGWEENSNINIYDFFKKIQDWKIQQIIFTDISRDGTLEGPNIDLLKEIVHKTNLKVIASGGISSNKDIDDLKKFNHPNLIGVIIGKAFYEKKVDLISLMK